MRVLTLLTFCGLLFSGTWVLSAGVSVSGDLFLGVWSPQQSQWESRVPVCVSEDADDAPYRVVATGDHASVFALANELGDQVGYRVFWHTGNNYNRRERLRPSSPSRWSYTDSGNCDVQPTAYIRVRLEKRDIDQAIPAIYQDTLVVMLSPL